MVRAAFVAMVLLIVMILTVGASAQDRCAPPDGLFDRFERTRQGEPAPAITPLEDGETAKALSDYRGHGWVINFWATWCAPCVKEMPALDRLRALLQGDGIEVLALSADRGGAPVVQRFYDANGITELPVLIDNQRRVSRAFAIQGLPTTILVDEFGHEVGRVVGVAEWDAPETVAFLRQCLGPTG